MSAASLGAAMYVALRAWLPLIQAEAHAAGVEPLTLAAIVYHESRGNPALVYHERDGACSIGLGQVRVAGCADPERIARLKDPAYNLRVSARILAATKRWCRQHPKDKHCRAGERAFPGGGSVNRYAGATSRFAPEVGRLRRALRKVTRLRPIAKQSQNVHRP